MPDPLPVELMEALNALLSSLIENRQTPEISIFQGNHLLHAEDGHVFPVPVAIAVARGENAPALLDWFMKRKVELQGGN